MNVRKEIWIAPPEEGFCVSGGAQYLEPTGLKMERNYVTTCASDRTSAAYRQGSDDNGKTFGPLKQLVEGGPEFDATHYMKGVFDGKNSATMSSHLVLSSREILVAAYIFPIDENGELYNLFGGYTFGDVGFILGTLTEDASDMTWETTQIIRIDPALSIRGFSEPTLARLQDGRILCICRGSGGAKGDATPGGSWVTVSPDEGRSWSAVRRLEFDDGGMLFVPSSISHLLRHSNGRLYWIANIVPAPPSGNGPRYPLVLVEINEDSLSVIRESMTLIDTKQEGEADSLQLSNFGVYEDRETGEIIVTAAHLFAKDPDDWTAPCVKYSIQPTH
ncbi:MAG: exo-alpha-sialidase [Candidatus Latescibacteria bacterium]|nr:exo-alpha-sialidase [Candidatus Latescibacterota bacterium]